MNRAHYFLLLLLTLLQLPAFAGEAEPTTVKLPKDAYDILKTAEVFTIGPVGIAGSKSTQETAFRLLMKQSDALAKCQKLLTEATPCGQLYALLGLRSLDLESFRAALPALKKSKTEVTTMSGCIMMRTSVADFAKQIEERTIQ